MNNQLNQEKNLQQKNLIVVAKIFLGVYLILPYILFFFTVLQSPYRLFEYFNWLSSHWFNPMSLNIFFFLYWSPVLVTIAGVSYIARMSNISRIPSNSSLYDVITLPTIQYGPLKIILPVIEEETLEENEA
ncbi:MAG: hypothetical protein JSW11_21140 [Candidatus Heimdallarchaeota archaeon]|nr:MAG: hypothetical protein JSW11_21140 [Candidatus Heimdallarchaeota archaeon]